MNLKSQAWEQKYEEKSIRRDDVCIILDLLV